MVLSFINLGSSCFHVHWVQRNTNITVLFGPFEKNIAIIKNLLFEHKVIFFRNQKISQQEQINLSKCFGALETHAYTKGLKEFPEIVRIIKEPNLSLIHI